MSAPSVSIVIPCTGHDSLPGVLASLLDACSPRRPQIVVVDDRGGRAGPLTLPERAQLFGVDVVVSDGRGPSAARDRGWRSTSGDWVAFLDDDVTVASTWFDDLLAELSTVPRDVGGVQGDLHVAHPSPTAGAVASAAPVERDPTRWITADMAYRRMALVCAGGFEQRFPRGSCEDAQLALRVRRLGWRLVAGERRAAFGAGAPSDYQRLRATPPTPSRRRRR